MPPTWPLGQRPPSLAQVVTGSGGGGTEGLPPPNAPQTGDEESPCYLLMCNSSATPAGALPGACSTRTMVSTKVTFIRRSTVGGRGH